MAVSTPVPPLAMIRSRAKAIDDSPEAFGATVSEPGALSDTVGDAAGRMMRLDGMVEATVGPPADDAAVNEKLSVAG